MKRIFVIACAVLFVSATASAGKPPKLAGTYKIKTGKMPSKKKYSGTVALADAPAGGYTVTWTTGAADQPTVASGLGVVFGKRLIAQFSSGTAPGGVGFYDWCEINGAVGSLCGSFWSSDQTTITDHGSMDSDGKNFEGTYQPTSDAGDTTITEFKITKVKKTIYAVSWTLESGQVVQGVGLLADKRLYVAWGDATAGLALYKIKGKKLDGQWVQIGGSSVGTEKLAKSK